MHMLSPHPARIGTACTPQAHTAHTVMPQHRLAPQQPHRHLSRQCAAAAAGKGGSRPKRPSPVSQGLVTVLKDELKVEKERYRTPEAVLDGPPSGFELQDRPNCTVLLLARSFGDEDIFVEVDINNQEDSGVDPDELDDGEEEEGLPPVVFSVNVTKEDAMMTFNCEADGRGISIRQVSLADADQLQDDSDDEEEMEFPPYTGPVFEELDDTLQQAFADYLEERGITAGFGVYLMELVHDKLEVEYMNWLRRAKDFVSS